MSTVINLKPSQDDVVVIKACKPGCDAACGNCIICDRACPTDCREGARTGDGHVWVLSDRIFAFVARDIIAARQDVLVGASAAEAKRQAGEQLTDDETRTLLESLAAMREIVVALFRREYPGVDEKHLDETFGLEGYGEIAARFLSRRMPGFGSQTPSLPETQEHRERTASKTPTPMKRQPSTRPSSAKP